MGGAHAVVIGAGIAGLLSAAALAERFERVTVYDRDTLPDGALARQGVPQSRQLHALLGRGLAALEELLPGLRDELVAAGAATGDLVNDLHWYLDGHRAARAPSRMDGISISRRELEWLLRDRVIRLPAVRVIDGTAVDGLVADAGRVRGVRIRPRGADAGRAEADLVVDAGGRGSRATAWLAELGYPAPPATEVNAGTIYVTRHFRYTPGLLGDVDGALVVPFPGSPRVGVVLKQERGRWAVALGGMLGQSPPTDEKGMLDFADSLAGPEVAVVLRTAEPLDDPVKMRVPASIRRRYDGLARRGRLPGGLIVTGDAMCVFNPVYGQGMTVAALEALALRRLLRGWAGELPGELPARFFRATSGLVGEAWTMSTSGDLRFPEVAGRRPPGSGLLDAYLARLRVAAAADAELTAAFVRVANMIDPPARLLAPATVARVLRGKPRPVPGRAG